MIFVTIGTAEPFDRLLRAVGEVDTDEEIVVQAGPSTARPEGPTYVDYLPYAELVEKVRNSRVVVSHAGVGTILTVLAQGKRPVVVARQKRYGEAIDDHQDELARRLADEGLVVLLENPEELPEHLRGDVEASTPVRPSEQLVRELRDFLEAHVNSSAQRR
jgi:UDP-N-acetylglucosamine transferase subunit ALG13